MTNLSGKKLLKPNSPLDISVDEEESLKAELITDTQDASLIAAMRENIDKRKKALAVVVDDKKIESTKKLAEKLVALDDILTDESVLNRVKSNIESAYDYNMFAKASSEIYERMMKQQLSTADPEVARAQGRQIKVAVMDSSGATMVSIGGDT